MGKKTAAFSVRSEDIGFTAEVQHGVFHGPIRFCQVDLDMCTSLLGRQRQFRQSVRASNYLFESALTPGFRAGHIMF